MSNKKELMDLKRIPHYQSGGDGFVDFIEDNLRFKIQGGFSIPKWTPVNQLPSEPDPTTGKSFKNFWDQEKEVLREALQMKNGRFIHKLLIFCWMRGEGKCQEKGSEVLMYDGTIKKVEDIVVEDLLMGDDNTPRKVLSLTSGKEEMFEIVPRRGESKVVTGDHKLSLVRREIKRKERNDAYGYVDKNAGNVVDISVEDYQKQSDYFKRYHMLFRVPIDWPEKEVPVDPYFLGLWLGDGHSHRPTITTMDDEIVDYLYDFADKNGMYITIKSKNEENKAKEYSLCDPCHRENQLMDIMREYDLVKNKHVPQVYKANSREVRLRLLAGLMDSDGYRNRNSIQFTLKSKKLSDDIAFLARSLGLHADTTKCNKGIKSTGFIGEYYRTGISGDCSVVPSILARKCCSIRSDWKDVLVTNIKEIKSVGEREYYGFNIDGNGRYVTGDFTVTHNSLLSCLIQLWKFCCFPSQLIVLGANSKDQTKFVHYDIIRELILNSPKLLNVVGQKNIQEKQISLRDRRGEVVSSIRSISSFSGIVSNITGYTFSEIFDMKDPKFFVQLDGSTRNTPNALGTIDSTVSDKNHVLYKLYETWRDGKDPTIFFSYRSSPEADANDFWHPEMTQQQLNSYRYKFPPAEFDRYFKNIWDLATGKLFSLPVVESVYHIGVDGKYSVDSSEVLEVCNEKHELKTKEESRDRRKNPKAKRKRSRTHAKKLTQSFENKMEALDDRLIPVDDVYTLSEYGIPVMASSDDLKKLTEIFDTDWAILAGIDRSDPMAQNGNARTMVSSVAKGLAGSRSKPFLDSDGNKEVPYIYFLLHMAHVQDASLEGIKQELKAVDQEFDGIDTLCAERWGCWDLAPWCTERDIHFEAIFPSFELQKKAFSELFMATRKGRFKSPSIFVPGSVQGDIMREEMEMLDYDPTNKWYGSPQKSIHGGIQDDSIFALVWTIYGGRNLTVDHMVPRSGTSNFGMFYPDNNRHAMR